MRIFKALFLCGLLPAIISCSARKNIAVEPGRSPGSMAFSSSNVFQTGTASWYGDDFQGKTTANGEIYDMHKLTAAHQTLPFHTMVEVENLGNGKKVLVRINDRGPFVKNRIIDLSFRAAQRLAMAESGTAAVTIRIVRWSGERADVEAAACRIQAGAFAIRANADDLLLTLGEIFPGLSFMIIEEDGLFKVLSEKISKASRCQEMIERLAGFQINGFIRTQNLPNPGP